MSGGGHDRARASAARCGGAPDGVAGDEHPGDEKVCDRSRARRRAERGDPCCDRGDAAWDPSRRPPKREPHRFHSRRSFWLALGDEKGEE